jgi:hypothetical protein
VTDDNAIDPAVIEGMDGTSYLAFGSFWSGIRMWALQWPSGRLAPGQGQPLRLADRFVPPNAMGTDWPSGRNETITPERPAFSADASACERGERP